MKKKDLLLKIENCKGKIEGLKSIIGLINPEADAVIKSHIKKQKQILNELKSLDSET